MPGTQLDLVGLVPAAGRARRLARLPCSKEIYPIGFRRNPASGDVQVEVISQHLFEKFRRAGATSAFVILRDGKWDVPSYYGEGELVGLSLAYLFIADSIGPPDTLDRAYPFIRDKSVAFGFPDIVFGPDEAFERLFGRLRETNSDIVLGLYPAVPSQPTDMVDVDASGRIRSLALRTLPATLDYTWCCAVWRPSFTEFMHRFVLAERRNAESATQTYRGIDAQGDLPVGAVIKRAVEEGMTALGVVLANQGYIDIGTPAALVDVMRRSPIS